MPNVVENVGNLESIGDRWHVFARGPTELLSVGSKYPTTLRDLLDGSSSYKLHLPEGIAAKLYWAVTIYSPADDTMPESDQRLPAVVRQGRAGRGRFR